MATVKITDNTITSIVAKVRQVHEADREKINNTVPETPPGFAEEVYSLLMPEAERKVVFNALPEWARKQQNGFTLRVVPFGATNLRWCPVLCLGLPKDTLALPNMCLLESVPGAKQLSWDGHNMVLHLAEDWSVLPIKDKSFIEKIADVAAQHDKLTKASKEASNTMRLFLEQHSTVQSAMKAFGPSFKKYIDPWLQMELDRVPPKRANKPKAKKEKVEVNIAKLVAKATAIQLNV